MADLNPMFNPQALLDESNRLETLCIIRERNNPITTLAQELDNRNKRAFNKLDAAEQATMSRSQFVYYVTMVEDTIYLCNYKFDILIEYPVVKGLDKISAARDARTCAYEHAINGGHKRSEINKGFYVVMAIGG